MKKSQAIGTRIDSKRFDFSETTKTFLIDESELCHANLNAFDQLWHDEGTKGFVLVLNGNEAAFVLDHTEREADGDIRAWRFIPHPHSLAYNRNLENMSVVIFNT